MALIDEPMVRLSDQYGVLWCNWIYDDTDPGGINDDGDPDNFGLVSLHGKNDSTVTRNIFVARGNGNAVVNRTLAPSETFSQNAGGPVKRMSDIPYWRIG